MPPDLLSRFVDAGRVAWERRSAAVELALRHARLLVWLGLAASVAVPIRTLWPLTRIDAAGVAAELRRKEDIHNLYYAAAQARWRDIPHWWVGSWIYPNVGFYRPLTSVLFFAEYRLFDRDFSAYNHVSVVMTAVNAGLLFLLTVSLFRHRRLARVPLGLAAVYYFATTGNTNFFAVGRVVGWWPAQNDALSLVFGLVALVLLDQYLVGGRRGWLVGAAVSFYLSVAAKEMGFMIGPMAIGLTLHRRAAAGGRAAAHRWTAPVALFATLSAALWEFRKLVVPKEWGPVMRRWGVLEKGLVVVFGPPFGLVHAKVYWATAAGAATLAMAAFGLRRRWRVITILAAALIASCLCAQFFDADGSFMLMFIGPGILNYTMVVTYMLGAVLFWRYRRLEAGLFAFAAVLLAYLPILHYGGAHYFYWPGAFSALMNAVFIACVVRAVPEMRRFANWDFSMPPWYQRFRESTLGLPPVPTPAAAMPRAGQTAPPGETAHE